MDIPPRQVLVHSLTLVDFSPPFFTIRVKTDGGLYVRTLVKVGSSLPFSSRSRSSHTCGGCCGDVLGHWPQAGLVRLHHGARAHATRTLHPRHGPPRERVDSRCPPPGHGQMAGGQPNAHGLGRPFILFIIC